MKPGELWHKILVFLDKALLTLKENAANGIKWAGMDGILNMETSALLTIFLGIFLPTVWAMSSALVAMVIKCAADEKRERKGEVHDLICASVGVIIGAILLIAL